MNITPIKITIRDLVKNYRDDGDGGVYGFDGKLTIRPAYQREFIYNDKQQALVIDSIRKNRPLNIMYWARTGDDTYEVLDGQQRTISIARFFNGVFQIRINGNDRYFINLFEDEQEQFLDYELTVYICDGSETEKLGWFEIVNIAGAVLTHQELLNSVYTGTWLSDAKHYFSKNSCPAYNLGSGYIKGNPMRQELLEKALQWICYRDGYDKVQEYMAVHQHDKDATDLWSYYQDVIHWAKKVFPTERKKITDVQDWGLLYHLYHTNSYNPNDLEAEMAELILDDDVTKKAGIIPYILSEKTPHDERHLSIRSFTEAMKHKVYEKQKHRCAMCVKHGVKTEYEYDKMQGDHIVPWSKGGKTVVENLQMLCEVCNRDKGNV